MYILNHFMNLIDVVLIRNYFFLNILSCIIINILTIICNLLMNEPLIRFPCSARQPAFI